MIRERQETEDSITWREFGRGRAGDDGSGNIVAGGAGLGCEAIGPGELEGVYCCGVDADQRLRCCWLRNRMGGVENDGGDRVWICVNGAGGDGECFHGSWDVHFRGRCIMKYVNNYLIENLEWVCSGIFACGRVVLIWTLAEQP
jgi:hypothetical protein